MHALNKEMRANMKNQHLENLTRPILIDICLDGTLTYRAKKEKVFNGDALPIFSVNSKEEAKQLLVMCGSKQYQNHPLLPNDPWYVLSSFSNDFDGLSDATEELKNMYNTNIQSNLTQE
jgi:hypothetical protein